MRVTILGSGTSTGIPEVGCHCTVCNDAAKGNQKSKNNRTRASILLEYNKKTVIIDTSADFREQMIRNDVQRIDAILLTHGHHDHIGGLDDIRPFNYKQGGKIPCYANAQAANDIRRIFPYIFYDEGSGSTRPHIDLREVDKPFKLFGKTIIPLPVMHGPFFVNGYRIDDFAYLTDYNAIPAETLKRMRGIRTLVVSAVRFLEGRPHPTHACIEESAELAHRLGVRRVFFTHLAHMVDARTARLPRGKLAYDGMILRI